MNLQDPIQILILAHAGLGGLALLSGALALIGKKGAKLHRTAGKVFFYSMLASALAGILVAVLPGHENVFLICIGVFSTYFLLSGFSSLRYKRKNVDLLPDKVLATLIIVTGLVMLLYPVIMYGKIVIVLAVFGGVGLAFGIRDWLNFRKPENLRKIWLGLHLGKMMGAYISAATAFVVVNNVLPGIWNWFVPGILGSFVIAFWLRKVSPKRA